MDEAWLTLDYTNGKSTHHYDSKKKSERKSDPPAATSAPQFPDQIMFAAGFCAKGKTDLYFIPKDTKVCSKVFVKQVLEPMFKRDVPRIFGRNKNKVLLHMDSASSHTSKYTTNWLKSNKINYITKDQWLPNSPKLSPMDYFANGYLKNKIKRRRYRTMRGLKQCARQEWENIPVKMCANAIESWPKRVLAVHRAKGRDIPQ